MYVHTRPGMTEAVLEAFEGDLDDYQQWLRSRGKAASAAAAARKDVPKRAARAAAPEHDDLESRSRGRDSRSTTGWSVTNDDDIGVIQVERRREPRRSGRVRIASAVSVASML